jgi:hypothetical protein
MKPTNHNKHLGQYRDDNEASNHNKHQQTEQQQHRENNETNNHNKYQKQRNRNIQKIMKAATTTNVHNKAKTTSIKSHEATETYRRRCW